MVTLPSAGGFGLDLERPVLDVFPKHLFADTDRPFDSAKDHYVPDDVIHPQDAIADGMIDRCTRPYSVPVDFHGWYPFVHIGACQTRLKNNVWLVPLNRSISTVAGARHVAIRWGKRPATNTFATDFNCPESEGSVPSLTRCRRSPCWWGPWSRASCSV